MSATFSQFAMDGGARIVSSATWSVSNAKWRFCNHFPWRSNCCFRLLASARRLTGIIDSSARRVRIRVVLSRSSVFAAAAASAKMAAVEYGGSLAAGSSAFARKPAGSASTAVSANALACRAVVAFSRTNATLAGTLGTSPVSPSRSPEVEKARAVSKHRGSAVTTTMDRILEIVKEYSR